MAIIKLKHLSDSKGERRKEGIRMKKKQNESVNGWQINVAEALKDFTNVIN